MARYISAIGLRRQVFFWLLTLAAFIAFLMLFSSVLLPFIAGMALAYFLDPVADRLEREHVTMAQCYAALRERLAAIEARASAELPDAVADEEAAEKAQLGIGAGG